MEETNMRLPSLWRGERLPLLRSIVGDDFDRFFDEFFDRMRLPARAATEGELTFMPDIDVIEHENDYLIKAELPGIAIDDVEVSMVGDALQIKGEKKTETEEKKENYYRCERTSGSFLRTIPLPIAVQADKIEAKLERGVLEVLCPKSEEVKPKKIEVKAVAEAGTTTKSVEAPRAREERAREKK
jgi:HSP20 family protein